MPRPTIWQSVPSFVRCSKLMSPSSARAAAAETGTERGRPPGTRVPGLLFRRPVHGDPASLPGVAGLYAQAWDEGRNPGISDDLCHASRPGSTRCIGPTPKVSLVGWSLGGIYARLLAHRARNRCARW